jgi:hypothetical protein
VAIGGIFNCSIVQNEVGGVFMGGKGIDVSNNDFEGQDQPLVLTAGTGSNAIFVHGNYFELCATGDTTEALIVIGRCSRFTVRNNTFSAQGKDVPLVLAANSEDGETDVVTALQASISVRAARGTHIAADGAAAKELSFAWDLKNGTPPASISYDPARHHLFASEGTNFTRVGGRIVRAVPVDNPNYRVLFNGLGTVANHEYQFFTFAVRYEEDVPHGPLTCILLGVTGGVNDVRKAWMLFPTHTVVGDTLAYTVGWRNEDGVAYTNCALYVCPYGSDATAGNGAKIIPGAAWTQSSHILPNHNVLDMVPLGGTTAPTSGTWEVGDIVFNTAPVVGGTIGWACIAAGSPGTWKTFGAIAS